MREKVWIVSELFYPETISTGYIMTEIADSLNSEFDISVIAGNESYDKNSKVSKGYINKDYDIVRIQNGLYNKNSLLGRLLGNLKVSFKLFSLMKQNIESGSKILMVTNPIFLVLVVSFFIKSKNWDIKLIVHDVFPENLIASKIIKSQRSPLFKISKFIFNTAFEKYNTIIVLGRDMKNIFQEKLENCNKLEIIENWSDTFGVKPLGEHNNKKEFLFAGNLGKLQGIDVLLKSLTKIKGKYSFKFIGNGAMDEYTNNFILDHNLKNVVKLDWQPRESSNDFLSKSDIGVISLSKGMYGLGVPSKLYNLLAAGKPILYIGEAKSEIYMLIKDYDIGWFAEAGNLQSISNTIEEIIKTNNGLIKVKSINSRKLAELKFSKEIILDKYNKLFR